MCWSWSRKAQSPTDIPSVFWVQTFIPKFCIPFIPIRTCNFSNPLPLFSLCQPGLHFTACTPETCFHLGTLPHLFCPYIWIIPSFTSSKSLFKYDFCRVASPGYPICKPPHHSLSFCLLHFFSELLLVPDNRYCLCLSSLCNESSINTGTIRCYCNPGL